jgi:hypothetical protein
MPQVVYKKERFIAASQHRSTHALTIGLGRIDRNLAPCQGVSESPQLTQAWLLVGRRAGDLHPRREAASSQRTSQHSTFASIPPAIVVEHLGIL